MPPWVQALLSILGGLLGAGSSIYGGQQAANAVPQQHDQPVSVFDPRSDPLLALLYASGQAGLGGAPDINILQAASPLNRLEQSLATAGGRGLIDSRDLRNMNQAIQIAQQAIASGQNVDVAALEDQILGSFYTLRKGKKAEETYGVAQNAVAAGAGDPNAIATAMAEAELGPDANPTSVAKRAEKYLPVVQQGISEGLSGADLSRYIVDGTIKGPGRGQGAGLFDTALSSAGFDSLSDLLTQELAYRERTARQTEALTGAADARFDTRLRANETINRLLNDYPAYGASDIERESILALQPYQAQELELANTLGYNPATNLALTRTNGIRDALAILGGRQALTNTSLMALRNELGQQTGEALATSGQAQSSLANAANLASQQALALAQLGTQAGMYQGSSRGGATAGAGAYLSDLLSMLGNQNQPGTSGGWDNANTPNDAGFDNW